MFTDENLKQALADAVSIAHFKGGFDTLVFRKGFEESEFTVSEKQSILDYISTNLGDNTYLAVKNQVDKQQFLFSEYYSCPECCSIRPRKFRGAYKPVIQRTFAGLMELSLCQQIENRNQ
jgi:hypothetical protein